MRFSSSLLGLAALWLTASPAFAQPSPAQIEAAKKVAAEVANQAFDAFTNGSYEEAIAGFRKAEASFHAPKFLVFVARAQVKLGRLVEAKATYQSIVDEKLTSYAPPEFFAAQGEAKKELAELAARIPTLEVRASSGLTSLTIDGKAAALGQPIAVDPGEHTIAGSGDKIAEVTRKVTLKERETRVETLEASATGPVTTGPAATSAGPAPGKDTGAPESGGFFSTVPTGTYVAYGVGAAGLILGGVFGGLTLAKDGDYKALRDATPRDAAAVNQAAADGNTFKLVADVGWAVGIVGVATGTILWAVSPSKPAPGKAGAAGKTATFVGVHPGGMTVRGTF